MTNETNFHELSFVQSLEFRYFSNRSKKYIDEFLKLLEDFNLDVEFEINDNLRNYNLCLTIVNKSKCILLNNNLDWSSEVTNISHSILSSQ